MQSNDEAVTSLIFDAKTKAGADQAIADGQRVIKSMQDVVKATSEVSGAVLRSSESLSKQGTLLARIARDVDPFGQSLRSATQDLNRLNGIVSAGGQNAQAAAAQIPLLIQKIEGIKVAATQAAVSVTEWDNSLRNALNGLQQLTAKYEPAIASAKQMTSELASLNQAYKNGLVTEEAYISFNSKIVNSYDQSAIAAQRLLETRAKLIAQGRADQNLQTSQQGISLVTGPVAGADFARDLRLQMERAAEAEKEVAVQAGVAQASIKRFQETVAQSRANQNSQNAQQYFNQVLGVNPASGAGTAAQSASVFQRSFAQDEAELENLRRTTVATTAEQLKLANAAQILKDKIDPAAASQRLYNLAVADADKLLKAGLITQQEYIAAQEVLKNQILGVSNVTSKSTVLFGLNRIGLMELQAAGVNTFQALASGMNPMRVAIMEGAQVTGAFVQGLESGLSRVLKFIISPLGLAITGIAALTVGIGLAVRESLAGETRLRTFGVIIRTMGVDGLTTAKSLEEVVRKLRDTGSAAADAEAAVNAIARTPGINPGAIGNIADVARNISAARGIPLATSVSGLAGAIAGGAGALTKYALDIGVKFNPAEQAAINLAILHRDRIEQLRVAYGAISRTMENEYNQSLSNATKFTIAFTSAWRDFLEAIGNTSVVKHIVGIGTMLLDISTKLLNNKPLFDSKGLDFDLGVDTTAEDNRRQSRQARANEEIERRRNAGTFSGSKLSDRALLERLDALPPDLKKQAMDEFANSQGTKTNIPTSAGSVALGTQAADIKLRSTELNKYALELVQAQARVSALTEAEKIFKEETPENEIQKQAFVTNAVTEATAKFNDELNKGIVVEDLRTKGVADSVKGFQTSTAEGLKAAAMGEAIVRAKTTGISVETAYRQILAESAAQAVKGAAEQNAAQVPLITGQQRLAEAAKLSAQAEHDVRIENEANALTQRALDAEKARGVEITGSLVEALNKEARAQILVKEAAENSLRTTREVNEAGDLQQRLRLQIGLQGQTPEVMSAQVAIMQKQQELQRDTTGLSEADKKARLDAVVATQNMTIRLSEAQREQQRIEDGIRSIADTIDTTLVKSISDAFDGTKVEDWGTKIKSMISSIMAQIANFAFIKPAIGTALGALGFSNAASQFGSFAGLGGGGAGLSLVPSGTDASGNTTFQVVSSGASLANNLFGGSSGLFGNTFSGIGSSINSFGASLGFATPNDLILSQATGLPLSQLGSLGAESGIFGGTTLTGILGPIGAGFGAGSLLNSLIGGNAIGGTIGSGIGSIAGSLAGAALIPVLGPLGPLLGGLLGGSGGGILGGLFGGGKSNQAAGAFIDASTGRLSNIVTGGNSSIDQPTIQANQQIATFIQTLLASAPGAKLQGSINLQNGVRDGVLVDSTVPGFEGTHFKFSDLSSAVNTVELDLARAMTGISDTMRTVINQVTDPNQLSAALQFAASYDNLKKAADSAFSSISTDTQKIGPFKTALDQISSVFVTLTDQAASFGLSLVPIQKAQAEANKRLVDDFNKGVKDALSDLNDSSAASVRQAKIDGDLRLQDAKDIGGDVASVNKLNAKILDDIWNTQTKSLLDLKANLTSGTLSGDTIAQQILAENEIFAKELALVKGGNLGEIANLATAGSAALSLSQTGFGNAPQTAGLRADILKGIDDILTNRHFASGTNSTPEGMIMVGENGPEWMWNPGGASIFPSGQKPVLAGSGNDFANMIYEIKALRFEVASFKDENTRVTVGVGVDTGKRIDNIKLGQNQVQLISAQRIKV